MITILIIDDEIYFAKKLQAEIETVARYMNLDVEISITDDPASCLNRARVYDIYFIDIVMPGHMGLILAKELRERHNNSELIFVSSYLQYMRQAFYVTPRAYIHKEHLKEELEEAFVELERIFRHRKLEISIKDNNRDVIVRPGDIIYMKSASHYVEIYKTEKGTTVVRNSLRKLEMQMKEFGFLRIHQRYLINMNFIEDYRKDSIIMKRGKELPVSAPYIKRVMDSEIERTLAGRR